MAGYNPFRPNSLAPIGMFEGRHEETNALDNMLLNTSLGNPQNFLLHGERGIGKSSLLFVEEMIASGKAPLPSGDRFNFLVVSLNLDINDTYDSVIRKLARGLEVTCSRAARGRETLRDAWSVISRVEGAGFKLRDKKEADSQAPLLDLCDGFSKTCEEVRGFYDGLLILIDEADKAPVSAALGSTLKTLTERVSRCSNNVLSVGLAGTSVLINSLRDSHESSPRLFVHLELKVLSDSEVLAVINAALNEASEKGHPLSMTDTAKQQLVRLSEGYPNFIQEFGFAAIQADTDRNVTLEDVENGAWGEHGAFAQLGEKYFKHLYLGKIASESYRTLLQTMAKHENQWVTKGELRKEAGLSETILTNALQALLSRQIIVSREGRKGFYRLPSKSFAAWLRAYELKSDQGNGTNVLDAVLASSSE